MNTHRFTLILPDELWEKIKKLAKNNRRAITQEIILAIEKHLETEKSESAKLTPRARAGLEEIKIK